MNAKENFLEFPFVYQAFQSFVGKFGLSRLSLYSRYLPYAPGIRVLDLGCGPGTACKFFKPDDYIGLDTNLKYIKYARNKNPDHSFLLGDFLSSETFDSSTSYFELIFAMGLMHHLPDNLAYQFFTRSYSLLPKGGRMICFDGCTHEKQSALMRKIVLSDRGKYIRNPSALFDIAKSAGFTGSCIVENDIYVIPYSLLILSLVKQ